MEELFFAGLIGNVQIDNIIPYILRMETAEYNSQMGGSSGVMGGAGLAPGGVENDMSMDNGTGEIASQDGEDSQGSTGQEVGHLAVSSNEELHLNSTEPGVVISSSTVANSSML